MSIYLIDYENVNADGFKGIEQLSDCDSVYVFYTTNAGSISFEVHKMLVETKAEMEYFPVTKGKNALDFQLTLFTGYLLGKGINQNIYIISNDKGFDSNISFYDSYLIAENVDVIRHTSIAASFVEKEKSQKTIITKNLNNNTGTLYGELCALLPNYPSCDIINISTIFLDAPDKQSLHTKLVACFKQEKGEEIYTALKSDFTSLKKYDENYQKLMQLAPECSPTDMVKVMRIFKTAADKNALYREIVAEFGQAKGLALYKLLKKEYSNINRTTA